MITLLRTDSSHNDFQKLVTELNKDLKQRNGESDDFFAQFNKLDAIKHVVLAYTGNQPVGCGAMKHYSNTAMEVKRMYVPPALRGQGIAAKVLTELETWARELEYSTCVLETGLKQPEAIRLYEKSLYTRIPNYGQYAGVADSVCFEKTLV